MTTTTATFIQRIDRARGPRISIFKWFELSRQRHALRGLTDNDLRDIGITRADANREADRRFWDAPNHWRA